MVPQGREPDARSLQLLTYAIFAHAHNWPPEVVDRIPAWITNELIDVENVIEEVHGERER